jgi:riboflavin synthase
MFTGIVEEVGTVAVLEPRQSGARLQICCRDVLEDLREGASIAVNGVCLTAVAVSSAQRPARDRALTRAPDSLPRRAALCAESEESASFEADLAPETLARSNLGDLVLGSLVNLERPVTPATRLSGHIVQGHVDGTGELVALDALGDGNWWLKVRLSPDLDRYLVHKGSIALDGISLTIAALDPGPVVSVAVIPHTFQNTALREAKVGTRVNVEVDILAKHVAKLLATDN